MKILTAADVEAAGSQLTVQPGQRLTPLARDRAKELGIQVVESGQTAPASAAPRVPARASVPESTPPGRPAVPGTASSGQPFQPLVSGALYRRSALAPNITTAASARTGRAQNRSLKGLRAGVVGAGHVGATAALRLAQSDLFEQVTMVDIVPGLAAGLALDMWHGASLYGFATTLAGSDNLAALADCDYIIITAGQPRQPGMTRTDLTATNAAIMASVCKDIRQHASDATLVVVSNPLEEMTHLAALYSGFPQERVLGMAGVLDSARFCSLVGLTGKARPQDVRALALGSHGPEMVIPLSQAFVGTQPIESVLGASTLEGIIERTRNSGGEVVQLLQKGSAYFSPGESAAAMVRIMASGSNEVIAACVRPGGTYGLTDARVGLPVRLGRHGLREVVELSLRPDELKALQGAAERIAERIGQLQQLPALTAA